MMFYSNFEVNKSMQCQVKRVFLFQFGKDFISVLNKKTEINTLQDTTKKKQMPTKDIFWPVSSVFSSKFVSSNLKLTIL